MPSPGLRSYVEAIPGTPLPHGILGASCTTITDVTKDRIHELNGVEWLGLGCCPVRDWPDPCDEPESPGDESPGAPPVKEFCRPTAEHAAPITVYAGAECSALGWTYKEARAHAEASMELGEQQALEAAFWRTKLAMEAVDLTPPEGPVHIAQGIAALEGCLAESYGGVGTLHIPAGAAALLGCCNIVREDPDGALRTLAGNCTIIGAGYSAMNTGPGNVPAEPGTAWLYITGPLVIRRGPVDVIPDRPGPSVNIRNNDRRVLVERTYVVGTTCTVCAIQIAVCP
ncbi:cupin [Streptomyces sp. NPDC059605]|uniref:cupin n=1 Tax=Streptomyces sp. NPDC059605 TaxID=3346882 RepID=UPI0036B7892B